MDGHDYSQKLTHSGNNLDLKTKLALEATGKVSNASLAISRNIRDFSNMIEHVAANEEKNGNHAASSPEVSVLDNWKNVWRGRDQRSDGTGDKCESRCPLDPVNRTLDLRVRAAGKMASEPASDLLSCGRSMKFRR